MSDQLFLFSKLFKLIKKHVVSWFQQHLDGTPKLSVVSNRDTASWFWVEWLSWGVCNQCGCKPLAEVDQQWFCQGYHPALDLTDFLQDGNKPWVPPVIRHSSWKVSPFMDDLHIKNFWCQRVGLSPSCYHNPPELPNDLDPPPGLAIGQRLFDHPRLFSPRWSSGRHAHLIQQKRVGSSFFFYRETHPMFCWSNPNCDAKKCDISKSQHNLRQKMLLINPSFIVESEFFGARKKTEN